jgi:hypothetical protein
MFRSTALALILSAAPLMLNAQGLSDQLAANGIVPTLETLDSSGRDDATTGFSIGALRFLAAIETALQIRWRYNLHTDDLPIPLLRLSVPTNPAAEPLDPGAVEEIFAGLVRDMEQARAPLLAIPDTAEVGVEIDLGDLWFDIDGNGQRGPGEDLTAVAGAALGPVARFQPALQVQATPTIRFDTADAAWLAAYTHLLAGIGELVVAFDSATVIRQSLEAIEQIDEIAGQEGAPGFAGAADMAAMVYLTLQTAPDPAHTRAARENFRGMVAQNRLFWARLAAETDNDGEWIPNARQTSALGIRIPAETEAIWLSVLDDAEKLLTGELLIPHWRYGPGAGIDLHALLDDPTVVDVAEWIHGIGLLPYARQGRTVTAANWRRFTRMAGGNATLFMIVLN